MPSLIDYKGLSVLGGEDKGSGEIRGTLVLLQ
jgi:hypothetical protein